MSTTTAPLGSLIDAARRLVSIDLERGDIAGPVASFADLHEYVDAGEYVAKAAEFWGVAAANEVAEAVDNWLRDGGHHRPLPFDVADVLGQAETDAVSYGEAEVEFHNVTGTPVGSTVRIWAWAERGEGSARGVTVIDADGAEVSRWGVGPIPQSGDSEWPADCPLPVADQRVAR